jgi:hypothetical protein
LKQLWRNAMRSLLAFAVSVATLIAAERVAVAQYFDDNTNCASLTQSGLYYYSSENGAAVLTRVGNGQLRYQANSRFYFVAPPRAQIGTQGEENVWHIRTQTQASAAPRASTVYVYRPSVVTRCSAGTALPEFSPDDRFVEINRYIDYHAADNNREPDPGLQRYFHLQVQDLQSGACIRTDDRAAYGNIETIYGFPDIRRTETQTAVESGTSLSTPVRAGHVQYQGLSSEFAYRDGAGNRCFAFTAPLPTGVAARSFWSSRYAAAMDAAGTWRPVSTLVVIKRLRGRRVTDVMDATVHWAN